MNQFELFLTEVLPREYAVKQRFANVSAPPRKLCLFSHAAYDVSKTKWLGEK